MTPSCPRQGRYHSHRCLGTKAAPSIALLHNLLAASKANQSILEQVDPEGIIASDVNVYPQVKLLPANEVGLVQISAEGSKHIRVIIFICRTSLTPDSEALENKGSMQKPFCTAFPS